MSNSLWSQGLQHTRLPCSSPTPGACSNSRPSSRWCLPTILSLSSPSPAFNLSRHQGLFQWVSSLHQVAKVLELQHQIFQWIFRTDFRIDWLDLLAVQGTLKSLFQHHSSKASILQCFAFSMVQLSHPYMIIGKTIALTRWTFVGKVMFLLFNMLCRLVIAFLPRSSSSSSSAAQSCPTLCYSMNRSMLGLPVHHRLPEFTQTHFHRVSDTIQPSHPLSSPSPPAPNPSQHQGLFQWVNSLHEVAKVLEFQL